MNATEIDNVDLRVGQRIWLNEHPWPDVDLKICYQLDDLNGDWYEITAIQRDDTETVITVPFGGGTTEVLIGGWAWTS